MSFFSRFYDFEKFPGIPREKFPNSQFFPFPWEKNLGGKTETLPKFYTKNLLSFYLLALSINNVDCSIIDSLGAFGPIIILSI